MLSGATAMDILKATLLASIIALSACQRTTGSDEASNNGANNISMTEDNGAAVNSAASGLDAAFITDALKGDNGEVAIGNLAAAQAMSQAAKEFGRMLATDHGAHKEQLQVLAGRAGVPVTEDPSDEAKANLAKLKSLKGAEFDKAFKQMMIEDHTKDIAKYEAQASSGDAQTSALAKETLPTLRKHLDTANSL